MNDNRRDFIKKGVTLAAMSVGGIGPALSKTLDAETRDRITSALNEPGKKSTIRIVMQPNARAPVDTLTFYKQMGLEDVTVWTDPPNDNAEYYIGTKKHFADNGLNVYGMGNGSVHNQDKIVLNLPGRDEKVEEYKKHLRNLGKAGITYTTYAHMGNGIWDSGRSPVRGASAREFDENSPDARGNWDGKVFSGPLSHGREFTPQEIWENYTHFIKQVAPVAEEAGVHIG